MKFSSNNKKRVVYNRVMESLAPLVKQCVLNELSPELYSRAARKALKYNDPTLAKKFNNAKFNALRTENVVKVPLSGDGMVFSTPDYNKTYVDFTDQGIQDPVLTVSFYGVSADAHLDDLPDGVSIGELINDGYIDEDGSDFSYSDYILVRIQPNSEIEAYSKNIRPASIIVLFAKTDRGYWAFYASGIEDYQGKIYWSEDKIYQCSQGFYKNDAKEIDSVIKSRIGRGTDPDMSFRYFYSPYINDSI